jgi:hypothetical protein
MQINKANSRAYELTRMCVERIKKDMPSAREEGKTLEEFLGKTNDISRRAWKNYAKAISKRNREGKFQNPQYGHTKHDLIMCDEILKFSTFVRSMTLFESYVNCWLMNYLLCKLELGERFNRFETEFARQLSPVHGAGTPPNITKILTSVSLIENTLGDILGNRPETSNLEESDETNEPTKFSLFDKMFFWVQFRNCIIHNGGLCTPRLFNKYQELWLDCMSEFTRDRFEERFPLTLSSELLHRCRLNIYHAGIALERSLKDMSHGRRGHSWAPGERPSEDVPPPKDAPEMLLDGDHELSLKWHTDPDFRRGFMIQS